MKKNQMKSAKFKDNISFILMFLPTYILLFLFAYLPMGGIIIAFKDYNYADGILGSRWNGFNNFKYFFTSNDATLLVRNTVLYNVVFIALGMICAVGLAVILNEVNSKLALKYYQTTMILPYFMSWVIVAYIFYVFLDPNYGILNKTFNLGISWYSEKTYWPFILVFANIWKKIGMDSIIYYAALMGIDPSLYEAATIDGASRWQQHKAITIPELRSVMAILLILSVGGIFRGDFGLFYQLPMNVGILYPVTDVLDTYVYRGLTSGDFGANAAIGLFQSVVGLIIVLASNAIVKKLDEDSAMF